MRTLISAVLCCCWLAVAAPANAQECAGDSPHAAEVCAVLAAQQEAWNAGDVRGFMDGYWNSEALIFASGGDVTRGWEPTLERYLARYDTPEAMGRLAFSGIEVSALGEDAALAFGRWRLERETDAPNGLFSLVFRRIDGDWRIVHDHTSSAD
ncbi:DUF4440 domain-containing protein [Marinicauda salina]|uniref:DUF4440 domain-containing protein n=1 Tax=Marinicauda salina TaxID=2135793 RepID=A0A2U2BRI6_9PROT|nr:nuclear transport factor 2 family protein [Marinicauda salina]PWE16620.1 DUF4440 domain-containing protein [Marinicauda salina]